jgi:hypothetical protein
MGLSSVVAPWQILHLITSWRWRECLAEFAVTVMISVYWMETKVWLISGYMLIILLTINKIWFIPILGHFAIFSRIHLHP